MNAGRELDALIAEKVMGWTCIHRVEVLPDEMIIAENRAEYEKEYGEPPPSAYTGELDFGDYWPKWCVKCKSRDRSIHTQLPRYSTDIAAAWQVVEKLGLLVAPVEQWTSAEYERAGGSPLPGYRWAAWESERGHIVVDGDNDGWAGIIEDPVPLDAIAETAPLAICRAALKALDD